MSLEATFTPVTVGSPDDGETDSITVSCYRSIMAGRHFVHLAAADGSSLYLSPEDAVRLARALEAASMASRDAEKAEQAEAARG